MIARLGRWIADRLIARAQRTPYVHLPGYLERWWLIPYNRTGIAARVHRFLDSDPGRDLHDHPWPYISIVLRGGYFEVTRCTPSKPCTSCAEAREWGIVEELADADCPRLVATWRGPGSVAFRRASSFHRIDLNIDHIHGRPRDCWTLFITFRARQPWGFLVNGEKVPASEYLGDSYIDTAYEGGGK